MIVIVPRMTWLCTSRVTVPREGTRVKVVAVSRDGTSDSQSRDSAERRHPSDDAARDMQAAGVRARQAWIGRQIWPDRLDIASDIQTIRLMTMAMQRLGRCITSDRGELFNVWRERWNDDVLLTGLQREEFRPSEYTQMAAPRDCFAEPGIK